MLYGPVENREELLGVLRVLAKAVSVPKDLHVKLVAHLNLIPKLIDLLNMSDDDASKEILLILINLTACDSGCVETIEHVDGCKRLIDFLGSSSSSLVELSLWALGNVAADRSSVRESLLSAKLPALLSNLLAGQVPLSLRRIACWVAAQLCYDSPHIGKVQALIEPLNKCLYQTDFQVLSESLWTLIKIMQDKFTRGLVVREVDVGRMLELMQLEMEEVAIPAAYLVGHVCAGDCICTSSILENGGIKVICELFKRHSASVYITKYTCWAIANLCLSGIAYLSLILDYEVMKRVAALVTSSHEYSLRCEAGWVLVNAVACCIPEQIPNVLNEGRVEALLRLLEIDNSDLLLAALEGVYRVLTVHSAKREECVLGLVGTEHGKRVEKLVFHAEMKIYKKANEILNILQHVDEATNEVNAKEVDRDIKMS